MKHIDEINKAAAKAPATIESSVTMTPTEVVTTLSQLKGLLISVLSFAKIFTNSTTDTKIDGVIAWLNQLPIAPAA